MSAFRVFLVRIFLHFPNPGKYGPENSEYEQFHAVSLVKPSSPSFWGYPQPSIWNKFSNLQNLKVKYWFARLRFVEGAKSWRSQ